MANSSKPQSGATPHKAVRGDELSPHSKDSSPSSDFEWQFESCPREQFLFLCVHEYFRSASKTVHRRLTKFGRQVRSLLRRVPGEPTTLPAEIRTAAMEWPAAHFMVASGLDRMLDVPYLAIEPDDRLTMLRHCCAPLPPGVTRGYERFGEIATARGAARVWTQDAILQLINSHQVPHGTVFLTVNPREHSLTTIKKGVVLQLLDLPAELHYPPIDSWPHQQGRQSPQDLLNALAAYRLRRVHGESEGSVLAKLGYSDPKSLVLACHRVEQALVLLEKEGWVSHDFRPPICFTLPYTGNLNRRFKSS